mgnify:CR=1 FL=1
MKKKLLSILLALSMLLTLLPTVALAADGGAWDGSIASAFAGGTGTESDPYQIADGAQLAYLASEVNKGQPYENACFVLTADIDLGNHDWTPIGNSFSDALLGGTDYSVFAGNLDGKGHTVSNISVGTESAPLESDVFGLFGMTGGKLSNLNLDGVTIYGIAKNVNVSSYVYVIGLAGALTGSASGPVENCHVANLSMTMRAPDSGMTAAYWIGGLVGALDGSQHIDECSVSGRITETSGKGSIGGLIGELGRAAKITYSHADVALDVKPDYYGGANVGGLIGKGNGDQDPETVISNCYATGTVTGGAYSGGFAGSLWGLNIKNCYATGDVTGVFTSMATFAGTDAPAAYARGSVTNCYTTGAVVGTASSTYAFAYQDATARSPITNCYFADGNSAIKNQNETAEPKTSEEMQTEEFKDTLNAGDPANGWIFREGETPLCGAEPADYAAVEAALGKIPADLTAYTDESVEALRAAAAAVIRGKAIAKQAEVDAMAEAIERAISELAFKPADYSAVDAAIEKANALDENDYVDFSAVKAALDAVVRGKNITEQAEVDAMAEAIERAISGLALKPADYSAVDAAIEKANALNENDYVDFSAVKAALDAVVRGKNITEQAEVDAMAEAIERAISGLALKPADYSAVDAAIEKANALNENDYVDFSAVKAALDAVVRGKNITEQAEVDAMAKAIEDAIAALVQKSYPVTISGTTEHGTVTVSTEAAVGGSTVTITVKPDSGYTLGGITVTDSEGNELSLTDNGNGAYTFTMPSGKVEIHVTFTEDGSLNPFQDVPSDAYYFEAVNWAVANSVTNGTSETTFSPNVGCTRAQVVTFLWRAAGQPEPTEGTNPFTDVKEGTYYYKAVLWAVEKGITNGTSETTFDPDETCTRGQIVTFLWRRAGKPAPTGANNPFADVKPSAYFGSAVLWAVEKGITNGTSETTFEPNEDCTRAQVVTFLFRADRDK